MNNITATNLRAIAEEHNASIENMETENYLKRLKARAEGGLFYADIADNLSNDQVSGLQSRGFTVNRTFLGNPATYRVCWD
jgi:hypothetical protein